MRMPVGCAVIQYRTVCMLHRTTPSPCSCVSRLFAVHAIVRVSYTVYFSTHTHFFVSMANISQHRVAITNIGIQSLFFQRLWILLPVLAILFLLSELSRDFFYDFMQGNSQKYFCNFTHNICAFCWTFCHIQHLVAIKLYLFSMVMHIWLTEPNVWFLFPFSESFFLFFFHRNNAFGGLFLHASFSYLYECRKCLCWLSLSALET